MATLVKSTPIKNNRKPSNHVQIPLQLLATLAASHGHAASLQLCLDKGAVVDVDLDGAARAGVNGPGMLHVLLAATWRDQ